MRNRTIVHKVFSDFIAVGPLVLLSAALLLFYYLWCNNQVYLLLAQQAGLRFEALDPTEFQITAKSISWFSSWLVLILIGLVLSASITVASDDWTGNVKRYALPPVFVLIIFYPAWAALYLYYLPILVPQYFESHSSDAWAFIFAGFPLAIVCGFVGGIAFWIYNSFRGESPIISFAQGLGIFLLAVVGGGVAFAIGSFFVSFIFAIPAFVLAVGFDVDTDTVGVGFLLFLGMLSLFLPAIHAIAITAQERELQLFCWSEMSFVILGALLCGLIVIYSLTVESVFWYYLSFSVLLIIAMVTLTQILTKWRQDSQ
jgi:hypothetical protein